MLRNSLVVLMLAIIFPSFEESQAAERPQRWSLALRGVYDIMDYENQGHKGSVVGAVRYFLAPPVTAVFESGYSQYSRTLSQEYSTTHSVTRIVPFGLGLRFHPATENGSRPFVQVLPLVLYGRSHSTTEGTLFVDGQAQPYEIDNIDTGWTPALQFDLGFEMVPRETSRLELGLRMLLTSAQEQAVVFDQPRIYPADGTNRIVNRTSDLKLEGFYNIMVFGGISFDL